MSGRLMQAHLPDVALPVNVAAGASNALPWQVVGFDSESVTIQAPAALDAATYTFEVSLDGGATYATLEDANGTAIPVPAAGKAIIYNGILVGFDFIRIASSAAIAAIRTFKWVKTFRG